MKSKDEVSPLKYHRDRQKRVGNIKRILRIFWFFSMIIPMLACLFLFWKVITLEKKVVELEKSSSSQEELQSTSYSKSQTDNNSSGSTEATNAGVVQSGSESVQEKTVYLTFDDGPSNNTQDILDVLAKYNVKATFFVVGTEDEDLLNLYKGITDSGHTLGMHSYSHQYSELYNSYDAFRSDTDTMVNFIKNTTGVDSIFYRFPGGSNNQVSNTDMSQFATYLTQKGIIYYDWNVNSGDSNGDECSVDELVNNVMTGVESETQSVVLFHDSDLCPNTVTALEQVIQKLQESGIKMAPITKDTEPIQHLQTNESEN